VAERIGGVTAALVAGALALAGCGGDDRPRQTPADGVRAAVRSYLDALAAGDWARGCRLMTPSARRDLAGAAGVRCEQALAAAASTDDELAGAQREVAGAQVRICGSAASVGPLGTAQQDLRLRRVGRRWLVAG
jgi:hypothetical protein